MTLEELNFIKVVLKRKDDAVKEIWLEKQLLRNLILDSGWMSEPDLDSAIADGKNLPENIRQVEDHFASSDLLLAEMLGSTFAKGQARRQTSFVAKSFRRQNPRR